jgi:hypothetical protein
MTTWWWPYRSKQLLSWLFYKQHSCVDSISIFLYSVVHKSLPDFRPLRYSSRDGHAEGEHVNRGRDTASFCPPLQVLDMCTLGDATDVNFWQIPRHRPLTYSLSTPCFVTTAPLVVKSASTPWRLVPKKTWRDSLSIDMFLSAVSVLVVAQSSSEIPEGLMNDPVYCRQHNGKDPEPFNIKVPWFAHPVM